MEVKLPENPNLYLILVGLSFYIFDIFLIQLEGKSIAVIILFLGASLFMFLGYLGLRKTQNLKDNKIKEEINRIKEETNKIKEEIIELKLKKGFKR